MILDCDWSISVQLIPNKSAKILTRVQKSVTTVQNVVTTVQNFVINLFGWLTTNPTVKLKRPEFSAFMVTGCLSSCLDHFSIEIFYQVIVWFLVKFGKSIHS